MQRIAALGVLMVVGLPSSVLSQVITATPAQPARPFTPSPPSTYPPSYSSPTYSAPNYSPTNYSPAYPPSISSTSLLQAPEANLIRGWYRDYLGRDVGQDVGALVNLLRGGMSPIDLQATILGSDEFYQQKGRDPQSFVRETLQAITWSDPSYADIDQWVNRLTQLRGDRFALAREILLGQTQAAGPQSQVNEIVSRLASASRLAADTIEFEIGSTPQGRQARLQAQALLDASNQLQRTTTTYRPDDLALGLSSADRAYQALQTTLSNPPGAAPLSAGIVRRIGTMLSDARGTTTPNNQPSTGGIPSGYGSQPLADAVAAARRAAESLIASLSGQAYQDYTNNTVLRDLDTLAAPLAALDPLLRSGISRDRLQWEVQSIDDSAQRIRSQLNTGRLPYSARLYWQSLDSSLAQMRDAVGVVSNVTNTPSTTMLRPTALHEGMLPLLDLAASQIDVFLTGTSPLVYRVAELPAIQADMKSLKNKVFVLRQQAAAGEAASVLKQSLNGMIGDYQDAFDRWNRAVATMRLSGVAQLSPIGETLNRVEQLINQALASGDLSPSGPTRSVQDLTLLTTEVNDARRAVAALATYREQRSIDLYLEQLAGYVQQINDALARQTPTDARRLAVGMQGVVGRMQTDIDSLNRTAATALAREVRQQAGDLQLRAERIGRLVDGIEAQLY